MVNTGQNANWTAEIIGYPNPSFQWGSNKGDEIPWGSKSGSKNIVFMSTENGKILTLSFSNLTVKDSGIYTLYAENGNRDHNKNRIDFRLQVKGTFKI